MSNPGQIQNSANSPCCCEMRARDHSPHLATTATRATWPSPPHTGIRIGVFLLLMKKAVRCVSNSSGYRPSSPGPRPQGRSGTLTGCPNPALTAAKSSRPLERPLSALELGVGGLAADEGGHRGRVAGPVVGLGLDPLPARLGRARDEEDRRVALEA